LGVTLLGGGVAAGLGTGGCGPNVSSYCPSDTPGSAVVAQGESAGPVTETKEPVVAAVDAGAAPVAAAGSDAGTDAAAAVAVAAPGPFNITGVVKSGTGPGRFAVVYLEDGPKDPARGMNVTIDQRMMMFVPYIAAVSVGGSATFVNSDPFPHNVFSPNGEKFDLGTLSKGGTGRHGFKQPGAYTLLCSVHPGMIGYIYVAPSSYFAVANGQGEFTIKGVPPGTYKVAAWLPKMAAPAQSVVLQGGDAKVELALGKQ
jgi:plastocyanin